MNLLPTGLWPVMLTPFTDNGKPDLPGLAKLTGFYISAGSDGLFANCLSSEMFELTSDERINIIKTVVNSVKGRIPVVATGTFGKNLNINSEFIKKIYQAGVTAAIVNSNQLNDENEDEGQFKKQLETLLNQTPDIPFGIYGCPVPYKRLLSPGLMQWMASTGRFVYFKDTCCDLIQIEAKIKQIEGSPLGLYNANMPTGLGSLKMGARGFSPIGANFFPELYSYLAHNYLVKEKEKEIEWLNSMLSVIDPLVHCCYPFSAKLFLKKRGLKINTFTRTRHDAMAPQDIIKLDDLMAVFKRISCNLKINLSE